MCQRGATLWSGGFGRAGRALLAGLGLGLLAGCEERERLTFPEPDGVGPSTTIEHPGRPDTAVAGGAELLLSGRAVDPDGVDTVHFLVAGGPQFPPLAGDPPSDTVRFGLSLRAPEQAGESLVVRVYGVDVHGNVGNTSQRRIVAE